MVSVCIIFRNDVELIYDTVDLLCEGTDPREFEIIIYNDGSVDSAGKFQPLEASSFHKYNLKVINNPIHFGIGYGFDRLVFQAIGDTIVLCGSDIRPRPRSWLTDVKNSVKSKPNTIGCAVCIGLTPDNLDLDQEGRNIRYGADLLFTVGINDLSVFSEIPQKNPNYQALFEAKWRHEKDSDEPYEIPCALGAFYFLSKAYYEKIGGFDTKPNVRFRGHQVYGSLEPYISLKSWLVGGGVTLYPNIEVGHIFKRVEGGKIFDKRSVRHDYHAFNRFYIAHTMIFDEALRDRIINFLKPTLNVNRAKKYIRDNYSSVLEVKERNKLVFTNSLEYICERFEIKLP